MITRSRHIKEIIRRLRHFEVVAILGGGRQVGKTTLAKQVAGSYHTRSHYFDLEDLVALSRLGEDPNLVLRNLKGLIIVDEVQRLPNLFPLLRVLSDRRPRPARFLVLGSASPNPLRQSSESLAGRINYYELNGLGLDETGNDRLARRWLRGGFPDAYLSRSNRACFEWLESFTRTFIERDLARGDRFKSVPQVPLTSFPGREGVSPSTRAGCPRSRKLAGTAALPVPRL